MWSVLILLTSVEFFLLARIVRSDMALTFSATLALCSFYSAIHAEKEKARKLHCFLMYGGLAAGTLIKGLVGLIIPGMVFFVYLLLTHQWSILRRLHLLPGALLCFVIVVPWYLWADARNPGYLRYYFWDDHFTRYLTDEFGRTKSWFYFFFVVAVGFLPWTLCLPFVAKDCVAKARRQEHFSNSLGGFAVPLLFWIKFEIASLRAADLSSRWPYLTGRKITGLFNTTAVKSQMAFVSALDFRGRLCPISIHRAEFGERFLPIPIRKNVSENFVFIGLSAALMGFIFGRLCIRKFEELWEKPARRLPLQLWGHRAFLLARGPVHGDGLR